jgi:S-DNA-T family DNA segregation ATPase FtsK/SpoIIIE
MKNEQNTTPSNTKIISKPRIISGITFILLSVVLTLSFISYLMNWKADQSQAGTMADKTVESSNLFGKIGDWLGNLFIFESIGVAAFVVAFLFFVFGTLIFKKNYFKPWKTISHSLFFICWTPIFFGAVTNGQGVLGGVYGYQIMDYLKSYIGSVGLWMVLLVSFALYFVLEFNLRPSSIKSKLNDINDNTFGKLKKLMPDSDEEFEADVELEKDIVTEIPVKKETPSVKLENDFSNIKVTQDFEPIKTPNQTSFKDEEEIIVAAPEPVILSTTSSANQIQEKAIENPVVKTNDDIAFNVEIKKDEDFPLTDEQQKSDELVSKHGLYDHKLDLAKFQMPSVELLKDYGNEEITINKDELEENKNRIVGLLKTFNVGISEIKATIGPTVTLYEIVPEAGIRVAAIKKLQDDIALNLSALGIRIIAPMPGKGTIGIEVPRKNPTMVSMRSVVAQFPTKFS